jgi:glycosyltransferase involved in cell wall biosynthesis
LTLVPLLCDRAVFPKQHLKVLENEGLMEGVFAGVLALAGAMLAVPVAIIFVEVSAALFSKRSRASSFVVRRPRVGILVPAHNESVGLLPTLADIKAQLRAGDRFLVVADNCTDDTAEVALAVGAEVTARNNLAKIGKGYALEWGVEYFRADPPDVIIVIDADCRLMEGAIERLAIASARAGRPAQALYLMKAPESATKLKIAEFAWRVKNWVRPLGLATLGLPCHLMGTGMAFPWALVSSANLATGQIVEDLSLGLDLATCGAAPTFCPAAVVTSVFPIAEGAAQDQRQRWEHGHLNLICVRAPILIAHSIIQGNWRLLALSFDLVVPPLVLLGSLVAAALMTVVVVNQFVPSHLALVINAGNAVFFTATLFLAWLKFGRDYFSLGVILAGLQYAVSKLVIYRRFMLGERVSQWIRTARN